MFADDAVRVSLASVGKNPVGQLAAVQACTSPDVGGLENREGETPKVVPGKSYGS